MKIKTITSEHGNDFSADMECEHCGHVGHNKYGYHDRFFHTRVIPAMQCAECGKNRSGSIKHTDAAVTPTTI